MIQNAASNLLGRCRGMDRRLFWLAYGVLGMGFLLIYASRAPRMPVFSNDTPSYLYFDPTRPIGYPAMLWLLRAVSTDPHLVQQVQLTAVIACYGFLAFALGRLVRSHVWGVLAFAMMLVHEGPIDSAATLIADAPGAALVAATAGMMLLYIKRPSWGWLLGAVVIAAVALTMRPVNLVLFPAIAIMVALRSGPGLKARVLGVALSAAGLALSWQATPWTYAAMYGSTTVSSPAARGLFGKTLFLDGPLDAAAARCDGAFIQARTTPVKTYLENFTGRPRQFLEQRYADYLRFGVIIPALTREHGFESASALDPILLCYARSRIASDPAGFLGVVSQHYGQLLTNERFTGAPLKRELGEGLARHPLVIPAPSPQDPVELERYRRARHDLGLPAEPAAPGLTLPPIEIKGPLDRIMIAAVQVITWVIGLTALAAVLLSSRARASVSWLALASLGMIFHGQVLISALIEVGLSRYMFPLWAISCVSTVIFASQLVRRAPWGRSDRPIAFPGTSGEAPDLQPARRNPA